MRASQTGGVAEKIQAGYEFERFCLAATNLYGHHAAEAGHLRGGDFVPWMRRQAGIMHGFNLRLRTEKFGDAMGIFSMRANAVRKSLKAAQRQPAFKRRRHSAAFMLDSRDLFQ